MQKLAIELFVALGGVSVLFKLGLSSEPTAVHKAFGFILGVPAIKAFIKAHGPEIKAIISAGDQALEKEIDAVIEQPPAE